MLLLDAVPELVEGQKHAYLQGASVPYRAPFQGATVSRSNPHDPPCYDF